MTKIEKNSFYRRKPISKAINLYPQFKDMPSGKTDTTVSLKSGLGGTLYVLSGSLPPSLTYGDGQLVGGRMRTLASSVAMGGDSSLPKLELYRVDSEIPITEASGTLAKNGDNTTILTSYIDPDNNVMEENFDGADKRLSSSFQTIGSESEQSLDDAWVSPSDGADKKWFGGGGFLGMGSNSVKENIAQYFCHKERNKMLC